MALYGPRPIPSPHPLPEPPLLDEPPWAGPWPGSLRRSEFIAACEALLADSPGCASVGDLHDLFDLLDPGCTGSVSLQRFSELLRTHRSSVSAAAAPQWADLGIFGAPSAPSGGSIATPLAGLRAWMLQHNWLFQDLIQALDALDDPLKRYAWPEFGDHLEQKIHGPWVTRKGAKAIFDQLKVPGLAPAGIIAPGREMPSYEVRVCDLIEALLDSKPFADEMARRCVRVIFREAHHREIDVDQQCKALDPKRTGVLDRAQLRSLTDGRICLQGTFADADLACLFGRFAVAGAKFRYEAFLKALKDEGFAFKEHLMARTWPKLVSKAADFESYAKLVDRHTGLLNEAQLRQVILRLDLDLVDQPGLTEVGHFLHLLAQAAGLDKDSFRYVKVVNGGRWVGPTLAEAVAVVCRNAPARKYDALDDQLPLARKSYLVAILFYKTGEAARKMGLSTAQAFDRLDRGGKGFLDPQDLRTAVCEVLGEDQTIDQLGIAQSLKMRLADFEQRLNFNVHALETHMEDVFRGTLRVKQPDFTERMNNLGVSKAVLDNWLLLVYPAGVPADGVERSVCETFFATHARDPPEDPPPDSPDAIMRAARRKLSHKDFKFRERLLAAIENESGNASWPQTDLVNRLLSDALEDEAQTQQVISAVTKASAYYARSPALVNVLRAETLLALAEPCEEHILEVKLEAVKGLGAMTVLKVSGKKPLEVCLRYWCRGTEQQADTTPLIVGNANDGAHLKLNFKATHIFTLSKEDKLHHLFEGVQDALTIQAWGGASREARQLLTTTALAAEDLQAFLEEAASQLRAPEVLLGSHEKWTLPFKDIKGACELHISVTYNKRAARDASKPSLPWSSTFAGSLVLCPIAPKEDRKDVAPWNDGLANTVPGPGAVKLQLKIKGFLLHVTPFKHLLARCLEGCAMPAPVHGAGTGLFLRFCLFPSSPGLQAAGCGWSQSSVCRLPEVLFSDTYEGESLFVDLDFAWTSQTLEPGEAVAGLRDSKAALQLWLRTAPCTAGEPSTFASSVASGTPLEADVQLADKELKLKELLIACSPDDPDLLRLRTLRNTSIDPSVVFKMKNKKKGDPVAELVSSLIMTLPKGPRVVSWFVDPEDPHDKEVDYAVVLHEVWLSRDFVTGAMSRKASGSIPEQRADYGAEHFYEDSRWHGNVWGADRLGGQTAPPWYFFAEFGQGAATGFGKAAPYFRSTPIEGKQEGSGWIRMVLDENAQVKIRNRPALGVHDKTDVEIRTGKHHGLRVRVLQMGRAGGSRLVGEATMQMPLGESKDGGPGKFFGTYIWRPLFHTVPESPHMVTVGRARISILTTYPANAEDTPPEFATPVLRQFPSTLPSGIFLPMYATWDCRYHKAGKWPLEGVLKEFWTKSRYPSPAPTLWASLTAAEGNSGQLGAVLEQDFEEALSSDGLTEELAFLRNEAAPLFQGAGSPIPWVPLMYWLALRRLAMLVLPKMGSLLQQLRHLDKGRDLLTGTVPLKAFQEALQRELADVPAAFMTLLARRPQWSLGGAQFMGHEQFDYLCFLRDLNDSGTGVQVSLGDVVPADVPASLDDWPAFSSDWPSDDLVPYSEDRRMYTGGRGCVTIGIISALHLQDERGRDLSTFVTYRWARPGDREDRGDFGRTHVVHRNSSPQWNYKASMVLPLLQRAGRRVPYPAAFNELELLLHVFHIDEWSGSQRLVGVARLPLAPLDTGFPEIDGYYYIGEPDTKRQIRASVTPTWSSITGSTGGSSPPGRRSAYRAHETCRSPVLTPPVLPAALLRPSEVALGAGRARTSFLGDGLLEMERDAARGVEAESYLPSVFSSASTWDRTMRDAVYTPGLFGVGQGGIQEGVYRPRGPGVADDVSTTELRFASRLSDVEMQLRSLEGTEEQQLEKLRARCRENLATLDKQQQRMLPPIQAQYQLGPAGATLAPPPAPAIAAAQVPAQAPPPPAHAPPMPAAALPEEPAGVDAASAAQQSHDDAAIAQLMGAQSSGAAEPVDQSNIHDDAAIAQLMGAQSSGAAEPAQQNKDDVVLAEVLGDQGTVTFSDEVPAAWWPPGATGSYPQMGGSLLPLLPEIATLPDPLDSPLSRPQAAAGLIDSPLSRTQGPSSPGPSRPAVAEEPPMSQEDAARQLFRSPDHSESTWPLGEGSAGLRDEVFPAIGHYVGLGDEFPSSASLPTALARPLPPTPALGSNFGWEGVALGAAFNDVSSSREGLLDLVGRDILAGTSL